MALMKSPDSAPRFTPCNNDLHFIYPVNACRMRPGELTLAHLGSHKPARLTTANAIFTKEHHMNACWPAIGLSAWPG